MKIFTFLFAQAVSLVFLTAQTLQPIAFDLRSPVGIDQDESGFLWVAESGTGMNDGAVTVGTPEGPFRRVIDSLPSFFDPESNETAGPVRVQAIGDYVGVFTSEVPGDLQGSILLFDRSVLLSTDSSLSAEAAVHQIRISDFVLEAGFAESNPYSMVTDGCDMFIADAAANAIIKREGLTGRMSVFATFPVTPNPLPFGPPVYEMVPTRIRMADNGDLLVSSLTGFPFLDGASNVWRVTPDGQVGIVDSGYTLVTDMDLHPDGNGFYTLQMAQFRGDSLPPFVFNSGLVVHTSNAGVKDTVASGFGPSPGMVVGDDGSFYVTHLFLGQVIRIAPMTTGLEDVEPAQIDFQVYPNPNKGSFQWSVKTTRTGEAEIAVINSAGQLMHSGNLSLTADQAYHFTKEEILGSTSLPTGHYYLVMYMHDQRWTRSFQVIR